MTNRIDSLQKPMSKARSTARDNSGLHDLPERVQGNGEKSRLVPVADFRRGYDRLWRAANVDYCACVGLDERKNWLLIAERILPEVEAMVSKRVNCYDLEQQRACVACVRERINEVRAQIASEEANRQTEH